MLDRDPDADQPPDPSMLRPRPRSHKPKNAPKKQPQRGLGVAQLEKLRLEEQSKQQEAVCLASLQNYHHGSLQQQEHHTPHFLHQHHHPFQQHQNSSLFLYPQIKSTEPSVDKPSYPLSVGKLNVGQNSFFPLTSMRSRQQNLPFPMLIPQQQLAHEDDSSLSPVAHVLDLCSPRHRMSSTAESHLHPVLMRTSSTSQGENPWLSHLYDRDSTKEKGSTITFLSSASCSDSDAKMQGLEHGSTENANAAIPNLHRGNGNLHVSKGQLYMPVEGAMTPFTELCLNGPPPGAFNLQIPSTTGSEPPQATAASGGSQTWELSSFQSMSMSPTWTTVDKVFNRKRSWACTQDLARYSEGFKGVDLNVSVDEMEWEVSKLNPYLLSTPFTTREGLNLSPSLTPTNLSNENRRKVSTDEACSECGSMQVSRALSDTPVDGDAFLSLQQRRSLNHEKRHMETSGEFLTLGPSYSSAAMIRCAHRGAGNCSTCPVQRKPCEIGSSWAFLQAEQAKDVYNSALSSAASSDGMLGLVGYKSSCLSSPFQRNTELSDFFLWTNREGCSSLLKESTTDESLDLELRLSL